MTTPRMRSAGLGATVVAGAGAVLLALMPSAAADTGFGNVAIEGSANPQVGCSYTLTSGDLVGGGSSTLNGQPVTFFDNGATIGTGKISESLIPGPAKVSWTPKTAGQHVLTATMGSSAVALTPLTEQVSPSTSTGSAGCPLPSISG
ncbi:hypothetical protein [Nocardia sp. NPDC046763]|uniref:hypothetical protein n=1 Tax=Nocardia sp. NPDC046763 TaxID=3155256 RepID=UPI0033DC0189